LEDRPPILNYQTATPRRLSGFAYFRVVALASVVLIYSAAQAGLGLLFLLGSVAEIFSAGHPEELACVGIVWGPIISLLALWWFKCAIEILKAGRDYNPHY